MANHEKNHTDLARAEILWKSAETSRTVCHLDRCELVQTSGHLVAGA